ncbi:MAG TPA: hypothetical protein VJ001_00910, partial [Rhodocyclaceae bacterium]|nr:hypothetical protein [Rhodocyclaceae bacterium]
QQKQGAEFENRTLAALQQQASAIELIKTSLLQQAETAKVTALTSLIDRDERRIETLTEWGSKAGNDNKYSNGIHAAKKRIDSYHEQLKEYAKT